MFIIRVLFFIMFSISIAIGAGGSGGSGGTGDSGEAGGYCSSQ